MEHPGMSLREQKKLAAREALSWAAIRLATERGLDQVRVEEIAAEVGVSPRTFNNYFSSKEEAICAIGVDRQRRIKARLLARPPEEPLWQAVTAAVMEQYSEYGEPDREQVTRVRLMAGNPALRGEYLKSHHEIERVLAEAITERTGTTDELHPKLMAATVCAATRVALDHWLHSGTEKPLTEILRGTLREVSSGLPDFSICVAHHRKMKTC
ncbi:TetR family transcriptional regulator [Amycolatopsis sp. NPDC059657]|uniref:acyl-CoA-like ligand-binding transcription factor n=1 Tax=Amycolatopsis sp. NPDC059657 TaxID=3346899 RepID=UPI003672F2D8